MTTDRRNGSVERAGVPGYILAGGRSRRFGRDKARAIVDGAPLIVTVARVIEAAASGLTVVARRPGEYDDLGFRTIGDVVEGMGPLGGLLTAMEDMRSPGWLLLSACDWRGLRAGWLCRLLDARAGECDAVAFRGRRREPLLALYHTRMVGRVREHLRGDDRSMHALLASSRTVMVDAPAGWESVVNVNREVDTGPGRK